MQKVALILICIGCLAQLRLAVREYRPCVVTGRQQAATETPSVLSKDPELDFAITQYVGVRCVSGTVPGQEVFENTLTVLAGKPHMVQRNAKLLAGAAGVLQIPGRGAITVIVLPIGHVQRVHVSAALFEQEGSNGRVHAAREAGNDALAANVPAAIFVTGCRS